MSGLIEWAPVYKAYENELQGIYDVVKLDEILYMFYERFHHYATKERFHHDPAT